VSDQAITAVDLDSAIVVARRVAVMLGRHATATCLTITARGLDVAVANDDAAHRIVDPHPFRERRTTLVSYWTGTIGETPVIVHVVTATPAPTPKPRVAA
jgi:hypothetical protein